MNLRTLPFWLVDVFAREPLAGNSLSVFLLDSDLTSNAMQRITQEMRQFETIFLRRVGKTSKFNIRIFTMEGELLFAGHPIIGAAALMHAELFPADEVSHFEFVTAEREIPVISRRKDSAYFVEMDQGTATTVTSVPDEQTDAVVQALSLSRSDLAADLPLQVVSTGLPYLIVPIRTNLDRAQIVVPNFEALLTRIGAKFIYVFDVERWEGRTWDNDGQIEDIATGSAVGPAAAYLVTHGLAKTGDELVLHQGRFLNRPSELYAVVRGDSVLSVTVRGQVCFVGSGVLELPNHLLHQ